MAIQRDTDYKPQPNVPLRGPVAFGGFLIHFLRVRFAPENTAIWKWSPIDTETELFIISGNTISNEIRNNRPVIYVNIGSCRAGDIVIGDQAKHEYFREKEHSYTRNDMNVTINIESNVRHEAHGLAWMVYTSLLAAKDTLRAKYRIANMGPFELLPPRPSKTDRETFVCTINFATSFELTWNVDAVQTVVRQLDVTLELNEASDPNSYFTRIYVQSLDDTH